MTSNHGRFDADRGQTPPPPPSSAQILVAAAPGPLRRAKLSEPVRLYVYALLLVALTGCTMAGWMTGEWAHYAGTAGGVVLGLVPLAEFVRASVYSPRGHIADLWRMGAEVRAGGQVLDAVDARVTLR